MEGQLNFAKQVKNEIATGNYDKEEMKYFLSGFIRNGGAFSIGTNPSLSVHTELATVAKLVYSALKEVYDLKPTINYEKKTRFGKKLVYLVEAKDKRLYDVLEDLEIFTDGGFSRVLPKKALLKKNFHAFVIGCFLATGSINNPKSEKTSYFLEMAFTDKSDALAVKRKLTSFKNENRMDFKYIKRRERHVLYLKKANQISVFLHFIGALNSMLDYENARVEKADTSDENRAEICVAANYMKTLSTASKDIEDIKSVLKVHPLPLFSEKEQAVIQTRLDHKDFNYRELAEEITENQNIPITKSGVVHILMSIREEARKLEEEKRRREESAEANPIPKN